jgi:hypothetical protein
MYTLVKAVCLARTTGAQWKEVELGDVLIFDIFNTYQQIYLEVTNVYLESNVYVDFTIMRGRFSSYNGTLNELLISLAGDALPTVEKLPNVSIKHAKYSDAIMSGYKINPTIIGQQLEPNFPVTDMTDLKISRPLYNTDMRLLHSHCLVSVNGYIHMTDSELDGSFAYVKDGCTSMLRAKMNQLGILSFLDIGELIKLPIKTDNIHPSTGSCPLRKRIYIDVPADTTDKTAILILGGYLVFLETNVFWQTGENTFAINVEAMPILERFFESRLYLNLDSLGLTNSGINSSVISKDEFLSDEMLIKYLTLSQSFIVLVDAAHLFTNKLFIKHTSLPGMFTSYNDPVYPLIVNHGKIAEYWKEFNDGYWTVNVSDSYFRNYVFTHKSSKQINIVSDQRVPMRTHYNSRGYLLEIGAFN